jgi:hypothetical protein
VGRSASSGLPASSPRLVAECAAGVSNGSRLSGAPLRHCQIALCSLSMGRISPRPRVQLRHDPAGHDQRLLVRQRDGFPASSAASVGDRPAGPQSRRRPGRLGSSLSRGEAQRCVYLVTLSDARFVSW